MDKLLKIPLVAAATASLLISLSGEALAGGDRHYRGGHDYGHAQRYRGGHHDHYYSARPYRHHKRHHNGNDDEELLIGLLVGGLFGYAISNSQRRDSSYDSYPPASSLPPAQPEPYVAPRYDYVQQQGTCLQEREYQTTVTIGGKQVPAYGTACLQPDGSWRRAPAQAAAY